MNLSALERAINTLESSIDSLGGWLAFWTTLVVIGLIVEYAEDLKDLITQRPFNWKLFRTIIGGLLITGGVAGELFVQFKESKLSTDLRSANHKVVAILNNRAAQAGRDAESAKATAKSFESQIEDAKARVRISESQVAGATTAAESAKATAKEFESQIADANARAEEAKSTAQAEQLERMKLQAVVSPRSLTLDQQRKIADALKLYSGNTVTLTTYGMDGEGAAIGTQIMETLRSAGITVVDNRAQILVSGGFEFGIHVRGPVTEQPLVVATANALSSIGKLQVWANAATVRVTSISGGAAMAGGATISGGGGLEENAGPTPPGTPVAIMVGIKPVGSLPAK